METLSKIEQILNETLIGISSAATNRDLMKVAMLTQRANQLENMKMTILSIEERLQGFQTKSTDQISVAPTKAPATLRTLEIEVTQGMINQNLLTLTHHVKRGKIQPGENLVIETLPGGEKFQTELLSNGNKLRERGAIARFYKEAGIRAGDFAVLTEVAPQRWTLRKGTPGEYHSRHDLGI
jgi:hypothetical protein